MNISETITFRKFILPVFIIPAVCMATLYLLNPLLFSDVSAIFSVLVSFAIFSIYLNSLNNSANGYIRVTGISFFFYGAVEFIRQTVFANYGISYPDLVYSAPLLDFLGKCIRNFAFLAAPLLLGCRLTDRKIFAYFFITIVLLTGLLLSGSIPGNHSDSLKQISNTGISRYIFFFTFLISLVLLAWKRHYFPSNIFKLLSVALILLSISELSSISTSNLSTRMFFLENSANILALLAIRKVFMLACFTQPFALLSVELERERETSRNASGIISAHKQNPVIMMSELDRNGNILSFNLACELVTGYSEKEVKNKFVGDYLISDEDCKAARRYFADGEGRDIPFNKDIYWKVKGDFAPKLLKWQMQAVKDETGKNSSIICTGMNITGYTDTLKELYFKTQMLEHANDSILVQNCSGKILYANRAFLEHTGYSKRDISTLDFDSIESAQYRKHNRHRIQSLEHNGRVKFESIFLRKDGRPVQVEVSSAITCMDGESLIVSVIRDNSTRKLYQKKLKDRYCELSALYRISATMSNSLALDQLFPKILDAIIELEMLDVERRGGIFVLDESKLKLVSSVGGHEDPLQSHGDVKIGDCLCGLAAKRGEIIFTKDIAQENRYLGNSIDGVRCGHIAIPLHSKNRLVGVMSLYLEPSSTIDESKNNLLRAIGNQVAVALENAGLYEEMKTLALHDPLTGFANRRLMEIVFERSIAEAKRSHEPLSVLMADIDFFKKYNDTHGHSAGDELLVRFSRVVSAQVRQMDFVSRYGGEEFFVILPGAELTEACIVGERIRKQVEEDLDITVSLGVAAFTQQIRDKEELIMLADSALYRAKQNGRNRIETTI